MEATRTALSKPAVVIIELTKVPAEAVHSLEPASRYLSAAALEP